MTLINIIVVALIIANGIMVYILGTGYYKWKQECYKWINKYTILNNQFMNYKKRDR